MSKKDYAEELLLSMQTLIDKSLEELPRDKIVVAKIIDTTDAKNGHYKATEDGNVIYDVYSEKTTYRKNDQVQVLISQNKDIQRTILTKYQDTLDNLRHSVEATKTENKFISRTENLVSINDNWKFVANEEKQRGQKLFEIDSKLLKNTAAYDTLYISFDCTCLLNNYDVRSGEYGIILVAKNSKETVSYKISSKDFFGNAYGFFGRVSKLIHYNSLSEDFTSIEVHFYQDCNFRYYNGVENILIPKPDQGIYNIKFLGFEVKFGYDIQSVEDNTVKIYTGSNLLYSPETSEKKVSFLWFNKSKDDIYLNFTDGTFDKDKAKPYISGIFSSKVKNEETEIWSYYLQDNDLVIKSQYEYDYEFGDHIYQLVENGELYKYNSIFYWTEWLVDNAKGELSVIDSDFPAAQETIIKCQETLKQTRVNLAVWQNGIRHIANENLVFENEYDAKKVDLSLAGIQMNIKHGLDSQSSYNFYDPSSNRIFDVFESSRARQLIFDWVDILNTGEITDIFWENAKISWSVPRNATMFSTSFDPGAQYEKQILDDYVIYSQIIKLDEKGKIINNDFFYCIKDTLFPVYINNEILCSVQVPVIDEEGKYYKKLEGKISIIFQPLGGISGTDYFFSFNLSRIGNSGEVSIKLFSKDNVELPSRDIYWRWRGSDSWIKITADAAKKINFYNLESDFYGVIEVKAQVEQNNRQYELQSYYIIPYIDASLNDKSYATLPTSIIYNNLGTTPQYYSQDWNLYKWNDSKKLFEQVEDINWTIYCHNSQSSSMLPHIDKANRFTVPSIYIENAGYISIQAIKNGKIIYSHPVYIEKNKYEFALFNNWNETLDINEETGTIMASMIGAGRKNKNNTFDGFIIGEKNNLDKISSDIGIYGFSQGNQTFSLDNDGIMSLGASNQGQIIFDGKTGIITSPDWAEKKNMFEDNSGVRIDLKKGDFIVQNGKTGSQLLFIDGNLNISANDIEIVGKNEKNPIYRETIQNAFGTIMAANRWTQIIQPEKNNNIDFLKAVIKNREPHIQEGEPLYKYTVLPYLNNIILNDKIFYSSIFYDIDDPVIIRVPKEGESGSCQCLGPMPKIEMKYNKISPQAEFIIPFIYRNLNGNIN